MAGNFQDKDAEYRKDFLDGIWRKHGARRYMPGYQHGEHYRERFNFFPPRSKPKLPPVQFAAAPQVPAAVGSRRTGRSLNLVTAILGALILGFIFATASAQVWPWVVGAILGWFTPALVRGLFGATRAVFVGLFKLVRFLVIAALILGLVAVVVYAISAAMGH